MPAVIASPQMRQIMRLVAQIADSDLAVLIVGESGSGKEVIARAVHDRSGRKGRPWIDVNCGALPEHLFESELFGHEKGAFSGAESSKPGLLELANSGTLFLDEVGELPLQAQVKLLRVLDGADYFRLGGTRKIRADVRIVAATNRNLQTAVAAGQFRADLFHRLAQVSLDIPPLRSRREDILPIADYYLRQQTRAKSISSDAARDLMSYHWPGNIRQLRSVILKAALLTQDGIIEAGDLGLQFQESDEPAEAHAITRVCSIPQVAEQKSFLLEKIEQDAILAALEQAEGSRKLAADMLGISVKTLGRKLKTYSQAQGLNQTRSSSRCTNVERRQQARKKAYGTAVLRVEDDDIEHLANLCDISSGGFRATHDDASLSPGREVLVDGAVGRHRAQVMWTRILEGRIESGFRFLAPMQAN